MKKDKLLSAHNKPSFDQVTEGMKIPQSFEQASYIVERLKKSKSVIETRGRHADAIEIDGETRSAKEWSELSFLKYGSRGATPETIHARKRLGKTGYSLILPVDEKIHQGRLQANYQRTLHRLGGKK